MSWGVIPTADARSRSTSTRTSGFLIWRSLVTLSIAGRSLIFASNFAAFSYSDAMSVLCSVYWYWLFANRAPTRTGGGFWRYTRMPGTCESFGPSVRMTSSALSLRS